MRAGPRTHATLAMAVACFGVAVIAPGVAGADAESDLRAAQRRANRAAAELAAAETERTRAEDAVAHVQLRVTRLEARVDHVSQQVRDLAVRLYVEGTAPLSRLLRLSNATDMVAARQYSHAIASTSGDALRQYRADREDLAEERETLQREQANREDAVANLAARNTQAANEVERLARVYEAARAAAAREAQRRAAEAAAGDAVRSSSAAGVGASAPPPAPAAAARGAAAPSSAPSSAAAPAPAAGDWICPVQGPRAFSNDYGAARWGGGSHMGNDILAPRGTPVVASVSGVVTHRTGAVSGLAYYLRGDDGAEYFGAHLDSFGASGRVAAGTVVGTVGNTGDASGGAPHLHFEIHPAGGGNVNPYSTLKRYC